MVNAAPFCTSKLFWDVENFWLEAWLRDAYATVYWRNLYPIGTDVPDILSPIITMSAITQTHYTHAKFIACFLVIISIIAYINIEAERVVEVRCHLLQRGVGGERYVVAVLHEGRVQARSHHDDSYDETFLHCLSAAKVGEIIQSAKSFAHFLHISGKSP